MIDFSTPAARSQKRAFGALIVALNDSVLVPLQRGDLYFEDGKLTSDQSQLAEDQVAVMRRVRHFLQTTDEVVIAEPQNIMMRQILTIIQSPPSDFRAYIDIFGAAARATALVPTGATAYVHIMRALAVLDGLIEQKVIASGMDTVT